MWCSGCTSSSNRSGGGKFVEANRFFKAASRAQHAPTAPKSRFASANRPACPLVRHNGTTRSWQGRYSQSLTKDKEHAPHHSVVRATEASTTASAAQPLAVFSSSHGVMVQPPCVLHLHTDADMNTDTARIIRSPRSHPRPSRYKQPTLQHSSTMLSHDAKQPSSQSCRGGEGV